ncbi:hypothetical protein LCM08_26485 [Salipiger pacificus]|nr:hypothetical protein [Alloyangia pacifica]
MTETSQANPHSRNGFTRSKTSSRNINADDQSIFDPSTMHRRSSRRSAELLRQRSRNSHLGGVDILGRETAEEDKFDNTERNLIPFPALSERSKLWSIISEMPEEQFQATAAFIAAVQGEQLSFQEPELIPYLRDNPKFRDFVAENLWSDRAEKGWKRRTDVFEFIEATYTQYIDAGLARSSWIGLDDPLLERIRQKSFENRKAGNHLPDGIPATLNLPLKEVGTVEEPENLMMQAMKNIYDVVNNCRSRQYRKRKDLPPCEF